MIPHPGQHSRVQHLEQQSRNPAHHHGGDVAVDPPGDSAWAEQPLPGRKACISRRRVPLPRDLSLNAEITWAAMAFLASCATEFARSVGNASTERFVTSPRGRARPGEAEEGSRVLIRRR